MTTTRTTGNPKTTGVPCACRGGDAEVTGLSDSGYKRIDCPHLSSSGAGRDHIRLSGLWGERGCNIVVLL